MWEYCPYLASRRRELNLKRNDGLSCEKAILDFIDAPQIKHILVSNETILQPRAQRQFVEHSVVLKQLLTVAGVSRFLD